MNMGELLEYAVRNAASDLHLSAGLPPMVRVDGDLRRVDHPELDRDAVRKLVSGVMNDAQRRDFEERLETDFSFEVSGLARFRVNAFNHHRGCGAVFRTIPSRVFSLKSWAPRRLSRRSPASRGAWCWSPGRPAPASRPRSPR